MKRLPFFLAISAAFFAGACGGGGPSTTPPAPVGNFSNASLNGQYAFSMSGAEAASTGFSSFFARVGTFTADGQGNIVSPFGVEDVNLASGTSRFPFTGGSYSILANGRGTLSLINATGTLQFSITLTSANGGFIVAMPPGDSSTASGNFVKQDNSAFSQSGIAGNYAFDFSGVGATTSGPVPESVVGQFTSSGGGAITTGIEDITENGAITTGQRVTGTYQPDPANASDLASFGRGTATLTGGGVITNYVFYIVDHTRVEFMETGNGATIGDAEVQSNIPTSTSAFSGGFVMLLGGASPRGPFTRDGRFTASGGALSAIAVDVNDAGTPKSGTFASGALTIDSTGTGRGTITLTDPSAGTLTFVYYLVSPTQAFIQDTNSGITADGSLMAQTGGPFTNSSLAGNFSFNWSGISSTNVSTDEEDFVGQFNLTGGNFTGAVDFNEFASGKQFFNIAIDGPLAISGDGTSTNAFTVDLHTSPANTLHFFAYIANDNTVLVMGSDPNSRVIAGTLTRQP